MNVSDQQILLIMCIFLRYYEPGFLERNYERNNGEKNKHLILNQGKINLARKILGAKTETETIELALDSIITEE